LYGNSEGTYRTIKSVKLLSLHSLWDRMAPSVFSAKSGLVGGDYFLEKIAYEGVSPQELKDEIHERYAFALATYKSFNRDDILRKARTAVGDIQNFVNIFEAYELNGRH